MVQRSTKKQTTVGGVILAALIALYGYTRPSLNEQFQWSLPPLPGASGQTAHDETKPLSTPADAKPSPAPSTSKTTSPTTKPGPLAGRVPKPATLPDGPDLSPKKMAESQDPAVAPPAQNKPAQNKPAQNKPATGSAAKQDNDDPSLRYGLLKDLGDERYVSPAGLLYTRGGAEGHRLDHLERHTVDDPKRPGKHGVFDGGMSGALKTIDRAYERAKTGQKTTKEMDEGRVIYTVDMGGRVGYIGGQDGNRQKKPMARRVRIVLDQQRVITAYPL